MLEFKATEIGYLEEYETISCGASNSMSNEDHHYINFQRASVIGSKDDLGIYCEIDDQSVGGYDIIEKCQLNNDQLVVDLVSGFKEMPGGRVVVYFDTLASEGLLPLDVGLRRIFIGNESKYYANV